MDVIDAGGGDAGDVAMWVLVTRVVARRGAVAMQAVGTRAVAARPRVGEASSVRRMQRFEMGQRVQRRTVKGGGQWLLGRDMLTIGASIPSG